MSQLSGSPTRESRAGSRREQTKQRELFAAGAAKRVGRAGEHLLHLFGGTINALYRNFGQHSNKKNCEKYNHVGLALRTAW